MSKRPSHGYVEVDDHKKTLNAPRVPNHNTYPGVLPIQVSRIKQNHSRGHATTVDPMALETHFWGSDPKNGKGKTTSSLKPPFRQIDHLVSQTIGNVACRHPLKTSMTPCQLQRLSTSSSAAGASWALRHVFTSPDAAIASRASNNSPVPDASRVL